MTVVSVVTLVAEAELRDGLTENVSAPGGEADVWWGEHGIDADLGLVPPSYVFPSTMTAKE
jgi:hypothetical protein